MADEQLQRLMAEGRLMEAAKHLEERGAFLRAVELYEQVWEFSAAARAAQLGGDLPRALAAALQTRQPDLVHQVLSAAKVAPVEVSRACAEACEKRGRWVEAAQLHERGGHSKDAARCYGEAGIWQEAARCHEALGDERAAIDCFRRHLDEVQEEEGAGGFPTKLSLGRLLLRFGRYEEAVLLLQDAAEHLEDTLSIQATKGVVAGLARLGYMHGAAAALDLLRERLPQAEDISVKTCLEDPTLQPAADGEEDRVLAGRYRLGKLLGAGGMGSVYLGEDLLTRQEVAVKVFTTPAGTRGRDAFHRFVREARATGKLRHPHIVSLLDFDEEQGFMVLEYMAGGTLAQALGGGLDLSACRAIFLQVLEGLAAAHQRGIIHRDIKPSNIFFTSAGAAKLGDFGVAHLQDSGQTQTGAFIGTLAFMSPEQISGEPVTFATDIYALGVMLFLMLTGRLPFSPPDLVGQHLSAIPPRPSDLRPDLPAPCDKVLLRCLAKRPEERHESLDALRREIQGLPLIPARPGQGGEHEGVERTEPSRRALDSRYPMENRICSDGSIQVHGARDTFLGRAVVLIRLTPGPTRQQRLALLKAAAAHGEAHLQRVLFLDEQQGQAILECPMGDPAPLPPATAEARLQLCLDLGRALAPLHHAGIAHGGVVDQAVTVVEDGDRMRGALSLIPALITKGSATPQDDVAAVRALAGVEVGGASDGVQLARWARNELQVLHRSAHQQQRQELMEQARWSAPAAFRRR